MTTPTAPSREALLAELGRRRRAARAGRGSAALPRADRTAPLPLSPGQ
ncbi:hypothetical protein GTY68_02865, partial [Streptomyces sp. SID4926]|nr:hypothetical protein [Streptomyces sp. SID4926]